MKEQGREWPRLVLAFVWWKRRMRAYVADPGSVKTRMATIYLSSTYEDLKDYRRVVYEALHKAGHQVIAMEDYVAADQRPVEKCLKDVEESDIYVGLFAFRYGYIPPANHNNPNGLSVTELEFRHAERLKKPCLTFVVNDTTAWSRMFDDAYTADDKGARIKALRQHLMTEKLTSQFSDPYQLSALVLVAVTRYLTENKQPATVRVEGSGSIAAGTQNIAIRSRPQSLEMVEPVVSISRILISYRREGSADVTGRIYDRLVQQFGREAVFKDVDSIPLGVDFRTYLDEQVSKCDVFLAVIGRDWMKAEGRKGTLISG
ncbi:MAG: DUF4062 domain-containing protein [Nitrospira sp.]|nr:MAG: DUF4062 domain-containing protein [Nitrospira sp.]